VACVIQRGCFLPVSQFFVSLSSVSGFFLATTICLLVTFRLEPFFFTSEKPQPSLKVCPPSFSGMPLFEACHVPTGTYPNLHPLLPQAIVIPVFLSPPALSPSFTWGGGHQILQVCILKECHPIGFTRAYQEVRSKGEHAGLPLSPFWNLQLKSALCVRPDESSFSLVISSNVAARMKILRPSYSSHLLHSPLLPPNLGIKRRERCS